MFEEKYRKELLLASPCSLLKGEFVVAGQGMSLEVGQTIYEIVYKEPGIHCENWGCGFEGKSVRWYDNKDQFIAKSDAAAIKEANRRINANWRSVTYSGEVIRPKILEIRRVKRIL